MVQFGTQSRSHSEVFLKGFPVAKMDGQSRKALPRTKSSDTIKRKDSETLSLQEKCKITNENGRKMSLTPVVESSTPEFPLVKTQPQRIYGKVVISLENCILPKEKLHPTPSMIEGLDARTEFYLRRIGCDFIQHAGIILKLPQTAMATAQVLFHRFYYARSFVRNDYFTMGMACIYLSSKVEEAPKRLRDIISVFTHVRQVLCSLPLEPVIVDMGYVALKNQVIKCERRLLKELGFCVHVKHPHKLIVMYLRNLDLVNEENQELIQRAWNYMNDSLRTDLFVRFSPEAVACGCIFLAARQLKFPLPRKPVWYTSLFKVSDEDVNDIATNILLLYSIRPPPILDVEQKVVTLRQALDQSKKGLLTTLKNMEDVKTPESSQTSPEDIRRDRRRIDGKEVGRKRSRDPSLDKRDKRLHSGSRKSPSPRNRGRKSPTDRKSPQGFSRNRSSRSPTRRKDNSLKDEQRIRSRSRSRDRNRRRSHERSKSNRDRDYSRDRRY